jgi:hypothetical protein
MIRRVVFDNGGEAIFKSAAISSWQRRSEQKEVCGTDGVISVDCGRSTRKIHLIVDIRAFSRKRAKDIYETIAGIADGDEHWLSIDEMGDFERLRADRVWVNKESFSGQGFLKEVEIEFTQLG